MDQKKIGETFTEFVRVIKKLRTPDTGCPWDLQQDHRSLRPYMIEEAYEAIEAIDKDDDKALCDELGDLLLQVVLHAQVASDRKAFSISDVVENVTQKMIRRHPHVFGDVQVKNSQEVVKNWEEIKIAEAQAAEKNEQKSTSLHPITDNLRNIPIALPALLRAQRLGEKAAKVHFDWDSIAGVLDKVKEELGELEAEITPLSSSTEGSSAATLSDTEKEAIKHELGDVLFALCQLARWLNASAEDSLRICTERFISRFSEMEVNISEPLGSLSIDQLEEAWQKAKKSLSK